MSAQHSKERLDELLADRAVWGLSDVEQQELEQSLQDLGIGEADESWDMAAGATTAALLASRIEEPPASLRAKLEADAMVFFVQERRIELRQIATALDGSPVSEAAPRPRAGGEAGAGSRSTLAPWLLAAAATVLAIILGWDRFDLGATVASERDALVAAASDLVQIDWAPGPSDLRGTPTGEVVWSDRAQKGYMTFRGLPANDPTERQYQLWIFDAERSALEPVDGGVFNIPAGAGEVIVRIDAKIPVRKLAREGIAFAVTVEDPGGVVVSEREHIVTVASL